MIGAFLRAVGVALAVLLTSSVAMAAPKFRFRLPPGWVDLSPGTPPENLGKVLPSVAERARKDDVGERLLFAAAPEMEAVMTAYLMSEADSEPMDANALLRAQTRFGWHGMFITEEAHLERIGGLVWGRLVGHVGGNESMRFVYYAIPGNPRSVSLMFAAPASSFDSLIATFDDVARATEGAENPPAKHHGWEVIGLLLFAAALLGWMRLRKKRPKPDAAEAK